jgi:FkbM family methyltransferase
MNDLIESMYPENDDAPARAARALQSPKISNGSGECRRVGSDLPNTSESDEDPGCIGSIETRHSDDDGRMYRMDLESLPAVENAPNGVSTEVEPDYSQFGEQQAILKLLTHLGSNGRFLDIGAADGRHYSNSLALAERGWAGVCVEAHPRLFSRLLATHEKRPTIQCVLACIYHKRGLVEFFLSPESPGESLNDFDLLSTTEESNKERWQGVPFTSMYIPSTTPKVLMKQFPGPFDFVNIDTEGTSVDLYRDLVKRKLEASVWCIEHDGRHSEVEAIANESGFETRLLNGINIVIAKKGL